MTFQYDSINSISIDSGFKCDSFVVNRIRNDSMVITRYYGDYQVVSRFILKNNIFYECRNVVPFVTIIDEPKPEPLHAFIPTFIKRYTIFKYLPAIDLLSAFVTDLGFDESKYRIVQVNNDFILIKQSLLEDTYEEIYYYDENYNIYKFINTWKGNKCVYLRPTKY